MRKNVQRAHIQSVESRKKARPVRNFWSRRRYIFSDPCILSLRSQPKSLWDGFGKTATGKVQCRSRTGKSTHETFPDTASEREAPPSSGESTCFLNMVARLTITDRTQAWDTQVGSVGRPMDEGETRYDSEFPSKKDRSKSNKSKASGTM